MERKRQWAPEGEVGARVACKGHTAASAGPARSHTFSRIDEICMLAILAAAALLAGP